MLRRTIGEHIEFMIFETANLWPVLAHPGQIEQVLLNLAVNARDAMTSGGQLAIETANVVIDTSSAGAWPDVQPGRYVRLRLSDTGAGMPEEVRAHAFEPFFTTKRRGGGSGLGLATVHAIITEAGGHAQIETELGRGTTMTVLLPAVEGRPTRVPTPVHARGGGRERILLVEDDQTVREVTRRILVGNGHEVLTASNGAEALALLSADDGTIDLLLTDVMMPRMLGKELAELASSLRPGIRVLFMSGYAQPVLASQGTLDPDASLVEKPFTESTLLANVREALNVRVAQLRARCG